VLPDLIRAAPVSKLLHLAFGPLLAQSEFLDLAGSRQRHGLDGARIRATRWLAMTISTPSFVDCFSNQAPNIAPEGAGQQA